MLESVTPLDIHESVLFPLIPATPLPIKMQKAYSLGKFSSLIKKHLPASSFSTFLLFHDTQKQFKESVAQFAQENISPYDKSNSFPEDVNLWKLMSDFNLHGITAPGVFNKMPKRDVGSTTALISRLGKQNKHRDAICAFLTMLVEEIKPNEYTFGTVIHSSVALQDLHFGKQIHSYAQKISLVSNVFVGSAMMDLYVKLSTFDEALMAFRDIHNPNVVSYATMIRGYVKERRFDEALSIFRSMPERNVVAWNTMVSGYSQSGKNEEAVEFFIEMLREGVIPSECCYPCVVMAAANIGALGIGRSVHACTVKFLGEPGLFLGNSLVSFYAKCGNMEDSYLVFNKMRKRNVVSWNAIICGCAQNGQGDEAIAMFHKMKQSGFDPNDVTLLGLLLACNHTGLVDDGYKYFNQARYENPSVLKPEHYACMVNLLSRSGRFQEAEKFLNDLPFDPGLGFWKALLGGCRVHSNIELGRVVVTRILEMDPGDVSSYVMLSNACSDGGRWGSVVKIRQRMKEKGLSRIPGASWIEIKNKVHVFVTCDIRHGEKDEIYRALGFFLSHASDSHKISPLLTL